MTTLRTQLAALLFASLTYSGFGSLYGMEVVTFRHNGQLQRVHGRIVVEAVDGGLLVEGQDGHLWLVPVEELVERASDDVPFRRLNRRDLATEILKPLPQDFRVHQTANYVICYNTSRAYAQWAGALFEKLHRAFYNFWDGHGLKLEPGEPLVALIFRDKQSYADYSRAELGGATNSIIGYYSLMTNRITTYDLTGLEEIRQPGDRTGSTAHVNQILMRPAAERTVATIIHEATHQLAYNSGLQTRLADNPLWLSEGLAIYFESPDLNRQKGWSGIGGLNQFRYVQMQDYLTRRPSDSLSRLITDDARLRDPEQAPDAYAEAWSLVYYLIRTRPDAFTDYLQALSKKGPLGEDTPAQRLLEFKTAFGTDLGQFDADFIRAAAAFR